ncbi:hypothetical protein P280DRAFT_469045 [Massarina eburnea CBS 473.64]|uniref:Metallo-beta-lactamase domain-containing protein n=1 Tax=Massarina eburnea CBS 473.64 TaxID=1395130 RepID=A0A6A6S0S1_9PLEO|nr:hypothetical protein P280DRAFT_469045 [Massarina eburnea CBS 473.64]
MAHQPSKLPWHPIPSSKTTCEVHLLQAGGLMLPEDLVLLPAPNKPNASVNSLKNEDKFVKFYVPDYCFLIYHPPTKAHYIFDLGMRKDLENLPPFLVKHVLPSYDCTPRSPAEILKEYGSQEQQPEKIKAAIFSHMHFDHVGDGGKAGFTNAELWVGPTCCTYARPGYPVKEDAPTLTENLPTDGSRKIVEPFISDEMLEKAGDARAGKVKNAKDAGMYEAVDLSVPGAKGWIGLGSFDRAFDVFGDGSAYLVDAPGHSAGHQMMLIRVKSSPSSSENDDFVLLAGDCYHHPALLEDPDRTARPPYSKGGMHTEPEIAIETMKRTRVFSQQDNILILGAHDFGVGEAIAHSKKEIEGLVYINDWRKRGWKKSPQASL